MFEKPLFIRAEWDEDVMSGLRPVMMFQDWPPKGILWRY
jgi:hypothetical protein